MSSKNNNITQNKNFLRKNIYTFLSILVISILYIKTLYWMVGSWIMNPYYSHGFLVLAISIYLIYRNFKNGDFKKELNNINLNYIKTEKYKNLGILILTAAIIINTIAIIYQYLWISAITYIFAIFGTVMVFHKNLSKKLAYPIFFLLLAVPYPIYYIANKLEIISASSAVLIASVVGIKIKLIGAEIITSNGKFIVGAPCSGIRSILAMLTIVFLYVYLIDEDFKIKVVLVLLSAPLALFANVLRIASVVIAAKYFGVRFAMEYIHTLSDVLLFVTAVIILMLFRRILSKIFSLHI